MQPAALSPFQVTFSPSTLRAKLPRLEIQQKGMVLPEQGRGLRFACALAKCWRVGVLSRDQKWLVDSMRNVSNEEKICTEGK